MRMLSWTGWLASLTMLAACGSDASGTLPSSRTEPMEIRLIDAPNNDVIEIVVTLTRIDVHVAGSGWSTLVDKTQTVDLLKLQGGTYQTLGISQVPSGHITQFRLYTTDAGPNFVTTPDGVHHHLTVPSGEQSGIKLKAGFDLQACAKGYITFDFDGKKSIFTHPLGAGAGDEWILRPVIRLHAVVAMGSCPGAQPPMKPVHDCDGGGHTVHPPTDDPPVPPPPVVTTPPPVTTMPPATTTTPPPATTTPPPATTTPPAITAPPPPSDPCAPVVCGGQMCLNGNCVVTIN